MNVAAFSDVFENSLRVQVRRDLIIPVASLPGLIVLKLFAWLDRHEGRHGRRSCKERAAAHDRVGQNLCDDRVLQ
jgi:predicted nucleotidyltransferase